MRSTNESAPTSVRVATWNVNGLRAAWKKGLATQLAALDADVVLLQEIRVTEDKLPADFALPPGFSAVWNPADRPGWSGGALWSRLPATARCGFPDEAADPEGRILDARIGGLRILGIYLPSGSAGPERQASKDAWMARFFPWAAALAAGPEPVLIVGDLNIAPTALDVAHPKRCAKLSGCLPHERAWFADLLATGWTDLFRREYGARPGPWTWWSALGNVRANDEGWRIDHALANAAAAPLVRSLAVHREAGLAISDHAPLTLEVLLPSGVTA